MKNLFKSASCGNPAKFVFNGDVMERNYEDENTKPSKSEYIQLTEANEQKEKLVRVTILEIPNGNNPKTVGFGERQNINLSNNYTGWVNGGLTNKDGKDWRGAWVSYGKEVGKISPKYPDERDGNFGYSDGELDWGGKIGTFNGVMGLNENKELVLFQYGDPEIEKTNFYWAFQNGMMLLKDGINPNNKKSPNEVLRSGIGFKENGTLVYIKTDDPITFHAFAELFKDRGVTNAIYLDGKAENVNGFGTIRETDSVDSDRPIIQFFDPTRQGNNNVSFESRKLKVKTNN